MTQLFSLPVHELLPQELYSTLLRTLSEMANPTTEPDVFSFSGMLVHLAPYAITFSIESPEEIKKAKHVIATLFKENPDAELFFQSKFQKRILANA